MRNREQKYYKLEQKMRPYAASIFDSGRFQEMDSTIQHGNTTTKEHVMNVANISLKIGDVLRIRYSKRELVRGALLHDYYLYDWHDKSTEDNNKPKIGHGHLHPTIALQNAEEDYELSDREREIIERHMWPINVMRVPRSKEAWLVVAADKVATVAEFVNGNIIDRIRK